jgi:hypothetical protein
MLGIRLNLPFNGAMIPLAIFLIATPLPLYPGATPRLMKEVSDPGTKVYSVERSPEQVAQWYAGLLRQPFRRTAADGMTTFTIAIKEHRITAGGSSRMILERGVVVWGVKAGSSFFALVDQEISPAAFRIKRPGMDVNLGSKAKVAKPRGADPKRYENDGLRGRSVRGRSVQGSFQ